MNRITYISFTRFPSEKAHSLFMAKSFEAFAALGYEATVVVPFRVGVLSSDPYKFYGVKNIFFIKKLPVVDFLFLPLLKSFWYRLGLVTFGVSALVYVFLHKQKSYFFTNDVFLALIMSLISKQVVYELHDYPKGGWWLYRLVGRRVHKILVNNHKKRGRVVNDFQVLKENVFAVHNGVTIEDFDIDMSKGEARKQLGLDVDVTYAVYTGHLYGWKGVDTLAQAAAYMPEVVVLFVGGTDADIKRMQQKYTNQHNIVFCGHKAHTEIPFYLKAADVLVLPNTGEKDISSLHTSPMKVFEYMASKRPIVASDIPSIREILNNQNATLVTPDDPKALAVEIQNCIGPEVGQRIETGFENVLQYSWEERAVKILEEIS